jgi:hypothetical protein
VYDNTAASGTKLIPTFASGTAIVTIPFYNAFSVGLTIVTAAATLIKVNWK